jgi:hypothetical protein
VRGRKEEGRSKMIDLTSKQKKNKITNKKDNQHRIRNICDENIKLKMLKMIHQMTKSSLLFSFYLFFFLYQNENFNPRFVLPSSHTRSLGLVELNFQKLCFCSVGIGVQVSL